MVESLILVAMSAATGLAVGAWYAYAAARLTSWSAKVEHLKPAGGAAMLAWKLVWVVVLMAGIVLPFNLAFAIPVALVQWLSIGEPFVFVGAIVFALLMILVGHRIARKVLRSD